MRVPHRILDLIQVQHLAALHLEACFEGGVRDWGWLLRIAANDLQVLDEVQVARKGATAIGRPRLASCGIVLEVPLGRQSPTALGGQPGTSALPLQQYPGGGGRCGRHLSNGWCSVAVWRRAWAVACRAQSPGKILGVPPHLANRLSFAGIRVIISIIERKARRRSA